MALIGRALLIVALVTSLYGVGASLYGARVGSEAWVASGRRAMYSLLGLAAFAFAILEWAFVTSDFAFNVVAQHSASTIPAFYRATAPWSSQQGSLLLWVFLLSLWSSIVLFATRRRMRQIAPYATAVLLGFGAFFTMLMVVYANPFATTSPAPQQGAGLDPLLMHPTMMFHPPLLYTGYTLMAIPFAFGVGALITRQVGPEWVRAVRRFALAAWLFLGIGIVLGALWSYTELGWGGYWGWDPVENAALMPWLTTTAFIHSIMIQEKRGMLKVWNASLVLLSGTLAIFGTFLVRSGVLDSIHAFGASTLGVPFVILLGAMLAGGIYLVTSRRGALRSEHRLDSLFSREAAFLFQNLVLVGMVFVIFWITMFPLISLALTGTEVSVGPPTFRPFIVPLGLILVALAGLGPIIAWRRVSVANLRRNFSFPVAVGLLAAVLLLTLSTAAARPFSLVMFVLGAFVLAVVAQEVWRGMVARRAMTRELWPVALVSLVRRNRRRYGGYMVHAGIAVLLIGVAGSSYQHSNQVSLRTGQSTYVDGYRFQYARPTANATSERITFGAVLAVWKGRRHVATLHTDQGFYPVNDAGAGVIGRFFQAGNTDSQIGLDSGLTHNIWTSVSVASGVGALQPLINKGDAEFQAALESAAKLPGAQAVQQENRLYQLRDIAIVGLVHRYLTSRPPATFLIIVAPLVIWLWVGAAIAALGGFIALVRLPFPVRRRASVPLPAGLVGTSEPELVREVV
jgi:cytochrome c-type biogenesis protein CcmF